MSTGGGKTLDKLPWSVVRRLTQLLDRPFPTHHNWSTFLEHAEVVGIEFHTGEVAGFELISHSGRDSPSEAIIQDLITRGRTTDDVYLILKEMGHVVGMKILQSHVSDKVASSDGGGGDGGGAPPTIRDQPINGDSPTNGRVTYNGGHVPINGELHAVDSVYGPLPVNVPPVSMGTTVRRIPPHHAPQDPYSFMYAPPMGGVYPTSPQSRQMSSSSMSITSNYQGHTPSPSFSDYNMYSNGPFNSPPPPPYSSQMAPLLRQPPHGDAMDHPMAYHPPQAQTHAHTQGQAQGQGMQNGPYSPHCSRVMMPPTTLPFSMESRRTSDHSSPGSISSPDTSYHSPHTDTTHLSPTSASTTTTASSTASIMSSTVQFNYSELSAATRNFTAGLVGYGAFGSVFRASVRGCGPFAIKKLNDEREMETAMEGSLLYEPLHQESFLFEVQSLVKYKHPNILTLVAISNDGPRPCLVYEFMANGSLADCLLGKRNIQLSWKLRMDIAKQIADALNFLHTFNKPHCLVHGDVKSSNILLDERLTPKLSDFGLARECKSVPGAKTTLSTSSAVVMGTMAYLAPEYLRNPKLSPSTDVYAFGVVMLELFTGQAADDSTRDIRALVFHLQPLFKEPDKNRELILHEADRRAMWPADAGLDFFIIATFCLHERPKYRSPMDQVRDQICKLLDESMMQQFHNLQLNTPH